MTAFVEFFAKLRFTVAAGTGMFMIFYLTAGGMISGFAAFVNHEKVNVAVIAKRAIVLNYRYTGKCHNNGHH